MPPRDAQRTTWVDLARGICIVMVVAMHSTLGVERVAEQTGWMHSVVAWTMPFRIPDFFFVSGFLAANVIDMERRRFTDSKIVHFVYFYVLWLAINVAARVVLAPSHAADSFASDFLRGLVEPFGMMWFIYILPMFYLVLRHVGRRALWPAIGAAVVLHVIAALHRDDAATVMASTLTGTMTLDSIALFLVFFLAGHAVRNPVKALVAWVGRQPVYALALLMFWASLHTLALRGGWPLVPGLSILFGLAGAIAIAVAATLLANINAAPWLGFIGRNSLAIYLAFSIPMAITRTLLIKAGVMDIGAIACIVTMVAVAAPLAAQALAVRTPLAMLFVRPKWAMLAQRPAPTPPLHLSAAIPSAGLPVALASDVARCAVLVPAIILLLFICID